ncbi:hypothetical protein [Mesorhizobium sp. M1143]|uniref:hypothetical protein n=1 Tax=Mesorhizobium sp. M1143 TaxID=2957061 RepID=UPI003334B9F6
MSQLQTMQARVDASLANRRRVGFSLDSAASALQSFALPMYLAIAAPSQGSVLRVLQIR